jgi:uncharacterized membrane protein
LANDHARSCRLAVSPSFFSTYRLPTQPAQLGALFLSFSIAPTDEISMLAAELDYAHALALIALSLLLTYVIVFASGFGTGQHEQQGPFQSPLTETVLAYVLSPGRAGRALLLRPHRVGRSAG